MRYVVIGASSGASMDEITAVSPGHQVIVDELVANGDVIGIGPFTDHGNLAIFRTEEAASDFVARDPSIFEGLVASFTIRAWADEILA